MTALELLYVAFGYLEEAEITHVQYEALFEEARWLCLRASWELAKRRYGE